MHRTAAALPGAWRARRQPFPWVWLLVGLVAIVAALGLRHRLGAGADLSGDEAEYRRMAAQVALHGVLSDQALDAAPGRPTAFREPLYPLLLGALTRVRAPAAEPAAIVAALAPEGPARRAITAVQWLLLLAAALAAAWWVMTATGSRAAGLAASIPVASSPALAAAASSITTEAIAAPLLLFAALALARAVERRERTLLLAAAACFGLLTVTRIGYLALVPCAAWLVAGAWPKGKKLRATLYFLALALLPVALWSVRNLAALGKPTLDEGRGAFNLLVRAELDRELRGDEARAALLAWIPPAWGYTLAAERFPAATILRPSPRNRDYYFTRSMTLWNAETERAGSRLEAAPAVAGRALAVIAEDFGHHLAVSAMVAWRGLFAERGALAIASLDLAFWVSLALHALLLAWAARALMRKDLPDLALVLLPLGGWILHSLLTEGRSRFELPALPVLWLLPAMAIARIAATFTARREHRAKAAEAGDALQPSKGSEGAERFYVS